MPHADLLVLGDEVETLLSAISAAAQGVRVAVCRQAHPDSWLGGLSTRGGLAYMDLTWGMFSPWFERFISACGVKRVCLDPATADRVLRQWITDHDIPLLHGPTDAVVNTSDAHGRFRVHTSDGDTWTAPLAVDGTPDADVAHALGEPWLNGLHGLLDGHNPALTDIPQHLGISPVFRVTGVSRDDFMAFEAQCRAHMTMDHLAKALPWHTEAERGALLTRPCYSPPDLDYIDMLNPIMGIAFHQWWQGDVSTYPLSRVWIDGGNIACLPDGSMSFNGMVADAPNLDTLLYWSRHAIMPAYLLEAMQAFEQYLQQVAGLTHARVIPPAQLYIRQTVHVLTRQVAMATDLLHGGLPKAAVGPTSYWLDTRGINLRQYVPGHTHYAKATFHTHTDYGLCRQNPYLAVVGRSAGYGPLAQGTCRIVQHAAWLGEAIGAQAAHAIKQREPFWQGALPVMRDTPPEADVLCQREWQIVRQAVSQTPPTPKRGLSPEPV
jgi:hypothetical protein